MLSQAALAALLAVLASAQQKGTQKAEIHPSLTTQKCTASGCTTQDSSIVLDANWRWLHTVEGYTNCYTGNEWDTSICPDGATCASACAVDGADYETTYGITTDADALTLAFKTGSNVGSRVYLMAAGSNDTYETFTLENAEFTFDVDVSNLPCGINGALYLTQMDADGGMSRFSGNAAGAEYGTGYCDGQCPRDMKFIDGEANVLNWTASTGGDANSGTGSYGTCCSEMDIWEANSVSAAYTPHPCSVDEQTRCGNDVDCGTGTANRESGFCDKDGCDFNSYRLGNTSFYGPSKIVDTSSKFTVVTQFIGSPLAEIRRLYVQKGAVISNSYTDLSGIAPAVNSITDDFCTEQKTAFGDTDYFATLGGMAKIGSALSSGMVLAMSIWDDYAAHMLWLDSDYPTDKEGSVARGTCKTGSGEPAQLESESASASVTYSNIKWGTLNSTFTREILSQSPDQ